MTLLIDRLQQGFQLIVTIVLPPLYWLFEQSWEGKKKDVKKRLKKWFGTS